MKGLFVLYLMISLISLPEVRAQQSTAEAKTHTAASGNKTSSFIITDAMIPLNDAIRLHARIWKPQNTEPAPAIFTLTPYTADDVHQQGSYFAKHGYTYVSVDTRGRGDSEGTFSPLNNEGKDGAQIVEWIAGQPWCDKNYNSGGNTIHETDRDARTATIKLHMSSKHPSALSLPVAND